MADNFFKVKKGLNVEPTASPTLNQDGDIALDSATNKLNVRINGATSPVVTEAGTQTLTNKTLTGNTAANLINGSGTLNVNSSGTVTVPNATDTLVGRATTDTLTNKTLTSPTINTPTIDVATLDGQASTPSNPSSGFYKMYVSDTTQKLTILDSSGVETTVGSGSGGGINYIANPDAEAATTGWATYADAAGSTPVDGTGGSPNITWTRTTTTPLRGNASFLLTKDAANRQGEGASYAFTISSADQAKMMQISFDYQVISGTYATGDLTVYIYDVTNAQVIQPAGFQIENISSIASVARCTFQTASNSTSYRLCFHVASTSASAYSLEFDNIQLGPQVVPLGAPVTDWVSYTPTGSWVSNTTYTGLWRRVGDQLEYQIYLAISGAPTATSLTINHLPSGLTQDTAKLLNTSSDGRQIMAKAALRCAGVIYDAEAYYNGTNIAVVAKPASGSYVTGTTNVTATVPATFASGDSVLVKGSVPIVGWSSSTVVSSSADTRVVAAKGYKASGQTGVNPNASAIKLTFDTTSYNTTGAFDTTNSRYTVNVPGIYRISGNISVTAANVLNNIYIPYLYKNGSLLQTGASFVPAAGAGFYLNVTATDRAVVGDYYELFLYGQGNNSASTLTLGGGATLTNLSCEMLQGPSQIAASEVIAFRANNTAGTSFTGGAGFTDVPFATESFDTHGAFSTPTFTAPAPGLYSFDFNLNTQAVTLTTTQGLQARLVLTGLSSGNYDGYIIFGNGASANYNVRGSIIIQMNAGDTAKLQLAADATTSLSTTANRNYLQATRLGGVM